MLPNFFFLLTELLFFKINDLGKSMKFNTGKQEEHF